MDHTGILNIHPITQNDRPKIPPKTSGRTDITIPPNNNIPNQYCVGVNEARWVHDGNDAIYLIDFSNS